jgi:hypothetical protein
MSTTINPVTPLVTGAAIPGTACTAETIYISASTAQSALNFSKLTVSVTNQTSAVTAIQPIVGASFSGVSLGGGAAIAIGTSGSATCTVVLGGAYFESARFQDASGRFAFSTTGTSVLVKATLLP